MSFVKTIEPLERRSATLFVAAGVMLALDAVIVLAEMVSGAERLLVLGEAFSAGGWAVALLGLLGLYPSLVDRSRWLTRTGVVLSAIGVVTFVILAAASLVYGAGIPDGDLEALVPLFLPGVILGSVVAFVVFSAAILRTQGRSRTVGRLLLVPPAIVVVNILTGIAGVDSPLVLLVIVVALAMIFRAIGQALRTEEGSSRTGDHSGRRVDQRV